MQRASRGIVCAFHTWLLQLVLPLINIQSMLANPYHTPRGEGEAGHSNKKRRGSAREAAVPWTTRELVLQRRATWRSMPLVSGITLGFDK